MSFGGATFIVGLMIPSGICLFYARREWVKDVMVFREKSWRQRLLMVGVVLASLSQLLVTIFLVRGFRSEGQSYATRASTPWAIANWTSLLSWTLTFVIVILGKGSNRRPLLIWCFVMPITSWLIFMVGYNY
jgi:hypothetical protein